jgi:hypothetical protein
MRHRLKPFSRVSLGRDIAASRIGEADLAPNRFPVN